MLALTLRPATAVAIDFATFEFPKVRVQVKESGDELLVLVWNEGEPYKGYLLLDADVKVDDHAALDLIVRTVDEFNADPITGWRNLFTAAFEKEHQMVDEVRAAADARSRAVKNASEAAGFAVLNARRSA